MKEIIEKAISDLSIYRNPDLTEFIDIIAPIVEILKLNGDVYDHITSINLTEDNLTIHTEYRLRGCLMHDIIDIPLKILFSDDPNREAQIFYFKNEKIKHMRDIEECLNKIAHHKHEIAYIEDCLKIFKQ